MTPLGISTADGAQVEAGLEIPPPARIAVGRGTAFVLGGYCYHRAGRTRALAVGIGGTRQLVGRMRLPRDDVYGRLDPGDPAAAHAYRSGFVSLVDLAPVPTAARLELELILTLADGTEERVPAGSIEVEPELTPPDEIVAPAFPERAGPRVAICMATYEPPADLLRIQLDSIREQTHGNWVCVISDDCSSHESFARLRELTDGDDRFAVSRSTGRLGFYRNFERALSMAPADADFVTLCDQDDSLASRASSSGCSEGIGGAELVYSDARIVSPAGDLVRPSYWTERRNNYTNFGSLLLANSVTGAASLFRRDLLRRRAAVPPAAGQGVPRPLAGGRCDGPRRDRLPGRAPLRLRAAWGRRDRTLPRQQASPTDPPAPDRATTPAYWGLTGGLLLRLASAAPLLRGAAPALLGSHGIAASGEP